MAKTIVIKGANFSENKLDTVVFGDEIPCTGIALDESTKNVTSMTPFTLTATPTPENTTDSVVWTSSDTDVATVVDGVVTPVGLGEVTITATCGSYSATCAVTINNVVPSYKVVCGYGANLRSSAGNALTTSKANTATTQYFILADDKASGLYPIESKTDVDTSPYRFVPIMIPKGATKVIISSTNQSLGKFKTRSEYCDSTKQETTYGNGGAFCVQGQKDTFDQGSTQNSPVELTIPDNVEGLDSCCFALLFANLGNSFEDYSSTISIAFAYGE